MTFGFGGQFYPSYITFDNSKSLRVFTTNKDRSTKLSRQALELVKDEHIKMSLQLQEAFGLRREEAIKFTASYADRGNKLELKGSWTKGGKPREIPIRTNEQRELLNKIKSLTGNGYLIRSNRNYVSTNVTQQQRGFQKCMGLDTPTHSNAIKI